MQDLEGEMTRLQEASAAAESRAAALELAAATAKDQLVRLTADFENFRRRTVRQGKGPPSGDWHLLLNEVYTFTPQRALQKPCSRVFLKML